MDPFFAMNVTNNSLTQMLHLMCLLFSLCLCTNYGQTVFFKNLKLLCLGRYFGLKFCEAFGVFSAGLPAIVSNVVELPGAGLRRMITINSELNGAT